MARAMKIGWPEDLRWEFPFQFRKELRRGGDPSIESQLRGSDEIQARIFELCFSAKIHHPSAPPLEEARAWARERHPLFADIVDKVCNAKAALSAGKLEAENLAVSAVAFALPDHFQVLERIGKGTFGIVFRAFDWRIRRYVAIKVFAPKMLQEPEVAEQFKTEMHVIARLDDPNIVKVYDTIMDTGGSLPVGIVMEFVEGPSLATILDKHAPLPFERAASITAGIADALAYAHSHKAGVIHRDLKPENVIIDGDDCPCVIDFGLALLGADLEGRRLVAGTPAYMSPEQFVNPTSVQGFTDVWSLGVILYEMLTATRPFEGKSFELLKEQICWDAPKPAAECDTRIPEELDQLCRWCLKKDAEERPTAAVVASRLRDWLAFGDMAPAIATHLRKVRRRSRLIRTASGERIEIRGIRVGRLGAFDEASEKIIKVKTQGKKATMTALQAVRHCMAFQLIAPSGAGKSIALKKIERSYALHWLRVRRDGDKERVPVPLYVELSVFDGSDLIGWAEQRLAGQGIRCSRAHVVSWLSKGQLILLLDGFDDVKCGRKQFITAMNDLCGECGTVRYVLTSRIEGAAELNNPRFTLELLSDGQIVDVLKSHVSDSKANDILEYLLDRGLLESFRLPILAWFLGAAHRDSGVQEMLSASQLYKQVFERRLKEAEFEPGTMELLQAIGYAMVEAGRMALEEDVGSHPRPGTLSAVPVKLSLTDLREQCNRLVRLGLLVRSAGHIRFYHDSFREHFCAGWLAVSSQGGENVATQVSRFPLPDLWAHYVGLADVRQSRIFLERLLSHVRRGLRFYRLQPTLEGNCLVIVLHCLITNPRLHGELRNAVVQALEKLNWKRRRIFHQLFSPHLAEVMRWKSGSDQIAHWLGLVAPQLAPSDDRFIMRMTFYGGGQPFVRSRQIWLNFMRLICALRIQSGERYVMHEMEVKGDWLPLPFLRSEQPATEAIKSILEDFADPDRRYWHGSLGLVRALFRLPADLVVPALRAELQRGGGGLKRILEEFQRYPVVLADDTISLHRRQIDNRASGAQKWIEFLCEIILSDSPDTMRKGALSALRMFNHGLLPIGGWRILFRSLKSTNSLEQFLALGPMAYLPRRTKVRTAKRMRWIVKTATYDTSLWAIQRLKHVDGTAFIQCLRWFIGRYAEENASSTIDAISQVVQNERKCSPDEARTTAMLLWAMDANDTFLAHLCIQPLEYFPCHTVRQALESGFEVHKSEAVREESLTVRIWIAQQENARESVGPLLVRALTDELDSIRLVALRRLRDDAEWRHPQIMEAAAGALQQNIDHSNHEISFLAKEVSRLYEPDVR